MTVERAGKKFFIFRAAIESHFIWLAVVGVINSVVSVYYYLRIIVIMYMKELPEDYVPVSISPGVAVVLWLATFGILQLGIYPDFVISLARVSVLNHH